MKFVKLVAIVMAASITLISCKSKDKKDVKETTTEKTETTTGNAKELIVNTWKAVQIGDNPSDTALNMLAGSTYEYTAEGKYIITGITPEPFEMNYIISDDGKSVSYTSSLTTQADKAEINKLEAGVLVMTTSGGQKITYEPK